MADVPTCLCPSGLERTCINPLCPRRPVHLREVEPAREGAQRLPMPDFSELPTGLLQIRRTLLFGVRAVDVLRVAGACRRAATRLHWQVTRGEVTPGFEQTQEDQVVTFTMMEAVLVGLGGALREAERRERLALERSAEAPAHAA